jgi:hypothetical protein
MWTIFDDIDADGDCVLSFEEVYAKLGHLLVRPTQKILKILDAGMHACMYKYTYTHIQAYTLTSIHTYTHIHTHTSIQITF